MYAGVGSNICVTNVGHTMFARMGPSQPMRIWSRSRRHYVNVQSFFYFFFDAANQILFYNQ